MRAHVWLLPCIVFGNEIRPALRQAEEMIERTYRHIMLHLALHDGTEPDPAPQPRQQRETIAVPLLIPPAVFIHTRARLRVFDVANAPAADDHWLVVLLSQKDLQVPLAVASLVAIAAMATQQSDCFERLMECDGVDTTNWPSANLIAAVLNCLKDHIHRRTWNGLTLKRDRATLNIGAALWCVSWSLFACSCIYSIANTHCDSEQAVFAARESFDYLLTSCIALSAPLIERAFCALIKCST